MESLSSKSDAQNEQKADGNAPEKPGPEQETAKPNTQKPSAQNAAAEPQNVMIGVLERHERIANRVRSAKK